jgi:hypothetical protein
MSKTVLEFSVNPNLLDIENKKMLRSFDRAARKHPLVMIDNVLRFKKDPLIEYLDDLTQIDLNCIIRDRCNGKISMEQYLRLLRCLGYSLDGYSNCLSSIEDEAEDSLELKKLGVKNQ